MGSPRKKSTREDVRPSTSKQAPNGPRPGHEAHVPTGSTEVMTFYPTWEQFSDFPAYIRHIEEQGAHTSCGIAKIVPPPGWHPRPKKKDNYSNIDGLIIKEPVKETIEGQGGAYLKTNKVFRKEMTVKEFRKLANSAKFKNPKPELLGTELERHYWKSILMGEPIYGADTEGSVYEDGVREFNVTKLGTLLDEISVNGAKISGVNTVYLYFGMWKTTFPWHAEDMDLYSINYLHFGAPKYWYAIPAESAERFERLMSQQFPGAAGCKAFLRHKNHILSPTLLRNHSIPFGTMVQRANEFIITFPKGYHMGFNTGYNCAESTNFASDRWIDFGKNAAVCKCRVDSVEIDMRPFMRKYRADEYEQWERYWYGVGPEAASTSSPVKKSSPLKSPERKRMRQSNGQSKEEISCSETSPQCSATLHSSAALAQKLVTTRPNRKRLNNKNLVDLWAHLPPNLFAEREFNRRRALEFPHCAVCQYLQPSAMSTVVKEVPTKSARLLSLLSFAKDPKRVPRQMDPAEDCLRTCDHCLVTVHPNCYANVPQEESDGPWRCMRCRKRDDALIRNTTCHLCELKAGAYIQLQSGAEEAWVHVICAILNRRTWFEDPAKRNLAVHLPPPKHSSHKEPDLRLPMHYLDAFGDEYECARFQCSLCLNAHESLLVCVRCMDDPDPTLVHATCAKAGRFLIEKRDYPLLTVLVCDRHLKSDALDEQNLQRINDGDQVIAWLDGGRSVQRGFVMKKFSKSYCEVDFLDGSTSKDTLPTDIIDCSCQDCNGYQHQYGARIRVLWKDAKIYDGYFRNVKHTMEYWVRLSRSPRDAPVSLTRSELYGSGEKLPAEVRRALDRQEGTGSPSKRA